MLKGSAILLKFSQGMVAIPAMQVPIQDYLSACKQDIVLAKAFFSRAALIEQISVKQMVEVASFHESMSMQLIQDPNLQKQLGEEELVILCQQDSAAKYILTNESLQSKISGWRLSDIGKASLELAKLIVSDPVLKRNLMQSCGYGHMLKHHKVLAEAALSDPYFRGHCSEYALAAIAETYDDLAWIILNDIELKRHFNTGFLSTLGQNSLAMAKYILQDEMMSSKLADSSLKEIALAHEEAALIILSSSNLRSKAELDNFLSWVAPAHFVVAKYALEDKELLEILMRAPQTLKRIGEQHVGLIDGVIQTGTLNKSVTEQLQAKKLLSSSIVSLFGGPDLQLIQNDAEKKLIVNRLN